MNERYNHKEIEAKWQKYWAENDSFKTVEDDSKEKLQECKRWFHKLPFTISILCLSKRFGFPGKCFCRYPEVSPRREGIIHL